MLGFKAHRWGFALKNYNSQILEKKRCKYTLMFVDFEDGALCGAMPSGYRRTSHRAQKYLLSS
jgi:hypothetical protein